MDLEHGVLGSRGTCTEIILESCLIEEKTKRKSKE